MSVNVQIDRVVLQDVSMTPLQVRVFQVALERQLSHLLSQQPQHGPGAQSLSQPRALGRDVQLGRMLDPIRMARDVAGSLAGCIGP